MALFAASKIWITGEKVRASDLNGVFQQLIECMDPDYITSQSTDSGSFRATSDPYPLSVLSKATSLEEEVKQLRYQLKEIGGQGYWYVDPAISFPTGTNARWLVGDYGTQFWFFNDTAPTGWTITSGCGDGLCAIKTDSGTWNVSGGTKITGSWAHIHATSGHSLTESEVPTHSHTLTEPDTMTSGSYYIWTTAGSSPVWETRYTEYSGQSSPSAHDHGDTLQAKINTGDTAGSWRPLANVGIIAEATF